MSEPTEMPDDNVERLDMQEYVINKPEDLEQFADDYGYKIPGHLTVNCSLNIAKPLRVDGWLSTKAGQSIEVGRYIYAGQYIRAGGLIKAEESIEAEKFIHVAGIIEAGRHIDAGEYIHVECCIISGQYIKAERYIKAGWYIRAKEYIQARRFIETEGNIIAGKSIEAGSYIHAGGFIKAGEFIDAGGFIISGEAIDAEWYIDAGEYIKAGELIKAGKFIKTEGYIFSFTFSVDCSWLSTRRLPFSREYYADMPPLKPWREAILDTNNCWDDLRNRVSADEAREICAWDGWHWIIRAQLEMFFGLKERHVVRQETEEVKS